MNTEQKKKLLADVHNAAHALGKVLDSGHDLSEFPKLSAANVARLRDQSIGALSGLGILEALLLSELEADNVSASNVSLTGG